MIKVLWEEKVYNVEVITYFRTSNIGILLTQDEDVGVFDDIISASIQLPNLEYGEIGIDSFDDKRGMINVLMDAEVIEAPHRYTVITFKDRKEMIPIVRLKTSFMNLLGIKAPESKQKTHGMANSARPAAK